MSIRNYEKEKLSALKITNARDCLNEIGMLLSQVVDKIQEAHEPLDTAKLTPDQILNIIDSRKETIMRNIQESVALAYFGCKVLNG